MAVLDLLDAFASATPVPGGGSAAALAGAVGTSLLVMVAGMEKTRTDVPEETADLAEAAARLRALQEALAALIDRDSASYNAVVAAYRLPKSTAAEQEARRDAVEAATHDATVVPLETIQACRSALREGITVARAGYRKATSDVGVAIELLLAGLRGAIVNVEANVTSLKDADFVRRAQEECRQSKAQAETDAGEARRWLA
jgi:formiminotetrahydrofolate cyclodeaminase